MAVRFVIGRAGSGKTHHCIQAVRERLRADPVDGPRLILLVPEQAALQTERALLDWSRENGVDREAGAPIQAAHRAEVLSFRRLAFRVLEDVGAPVQPALTEPARAMVLRHLIARHARELRYYGRPTRPGRTGGRLSGFVERLGQTVGELIEEAVAPGEFSAFAESTQSASVGDDAIGTLWGLRPAAQTEQPGVDPAQSAKLHDVALIYRAYIDFLGTGLLDPSQYLQVARGHMDRCSWLHGSFVWVDGFASFSGQERLTLLRVARMCASADIALLVDPRLVGFGNRDSAESSPADLFSKTLRSHQDLSAGLREAGVSIEEPLVLAPEVPPRFQGSPPLSRLESTLFSVARDEAPATSETEAAVEIVQLPNRRIEADYAVAQILRWVQDRARGYRFSDLAVIVRDIELYHDLLSDALQSRGVPFFIDRRRPVVHHPLVELIRAAFALATSDLSIESVSASLKTGLLPIPTDDADLLENYLIAHGIQGAGEWRVDEWSFRSRSGFLDVEEEPTANESALLEKINEIRIAFLNLFDAWLRFSTSRESPTGSVWAEALGLLIQRLGVPESLGRWSEQARQDGDIERAEEDRQVWEGVMSLVDDLAFALHDAPMTVAETAEVFEAGLSQLTLGLAPPTIDQLLVGSIERSRHPRIKAAVVVGLNDEVFPKRPAEDSVLNDDDRTIMLDAGVRIGLPARRRLVDESMLCYIALTRAGERVVVTYSSADETGRALRPSPYLPAILSACPGVDVRCVGEPIRTRDTWDVQTSQDLTERLTVEFRSRTTAALDKPSPRGRWNAIYELRRRALACDSMAARAFTALDARLDSRLSASAVERMVGGPLQTSVSKLESYAACPFQFFARHGLKLKKREKAEPEPVDEGKVHHAVLEDFIRNMSGASRGWDALTEDQLVHELAGSCRRVEERLPDDASVSQARNSYLLRRSAEQLARVVRAQQRVGARGRSRPGRAEVAFGFSTEGSLPALELSTPSGRRVRLRGYIDRVDLAELSDELLGVVIDYKRTRDKRLGLSGVYHGLSLQLIAYLLVLAEHGRTLAGRPIRPIGGLFVSLMSRYQVVDHPSEADEETTDRRSHSPRGLICVDDIAALETSPPGGRSPSYAVHRKTDGTFGHMDQSDAAGRPAFERVLSHVEVKLGELADGILDGEVTPRPFRLGGFSPCSWCEMASVCRFDPSIGRRRHLDSMKRTRVFDLLENPKAGS